MIHISKLSEKRVAKVEDVVNIGDVVTVKVVEVDKMGRINLSMKPSDMTAKAEEAKEEKEVKENE
jgi:polyribonucleotide nucleotidyltransferase